MMKSNLQREDFLISLYKKIDIKLKIILFSTLSWGIFAHGMALFNKYSIHDDIHSLFGVGTTYESGRWFLHIVGFIVTDILQSPHFSLPLINGVLSLVCIAVAAYLIADLFDIHKPILYILISGIMATSPSIASLFGYMFTAPYYALAMLLSITGAYILCKYRNVLAFMIGSLSITCSLGIYQAYYSMILSVFALYFIKQIDSIPFTWRKYVKTSIYLLFACILSIVLYFIFAYLTLRHYNTDLTSYHGISSAGQDGIREYIDRVFYAYQYYFSPIKGYSTMFPMRVISIYYILIVFTLLVWGYEILSLIVRKKYSQALQKGALVLTWPLAVNFIFVMASPEYVYGLMTYNHIFNFILIVYFVNQINLSARKYSQIIYICGSLLLLLTSLLYSRYDNAFYLKFAFAQQRAISYATTLITQIKSTDGYNEEYPVTFIGNNTILDKSTSGLAEFESIGQAPLPSVNNGIRYYSLMKVMSNWCAFNPRIVSSSNFENRLEVLEMPFYPNEGSIKVIDKTVVVKFKD